MKIQVPKIGKNKLLIVGLIAVVIVGYYIFRSGSKSEPLTTVQAGGQEVIGQEIIMELNRLKALQNIKDDIFKDPSFLSLQDFTQTVSPQTLGRNNPFAPI